MTLPGQLRSYHISVFTKSPFVVSAAFRWLSLSNLVRHGVVRWILYAYSRFRQVSGVVDSY